MYRIVIITITFIVFIPLVWKFFDWLDLKIEKALEKDKNAVDIINEVKDKQQELNEKAQKIIKMQKENEAEKDAIDRFIGQKPYDGEDR